GSGRHDSAARSLTRGVLIAASGMTTNCRRFMLARSYRAPVLSSTVEAHPFAVDDGFEIAAGLAGVGDGARLVFSGAPPRLWLNLGARRDRNDGRKGPRWSTGRFNEKLGNIDPAHVLIGAKRGRRL